VTLLALLAIPSFVAFCFLAIIHTLQTTSLRLAESAPFPSEALLQEYFPAAPALRTAQAIAPRVRSYEYLLKNCTSLSGRVAFSREPNLYTLRRVPAAATFLREYRGSWPDSSFRTMASPDAKYRPFAARAIFSRRRTRLSALARRPRSLSTALMSYS
jgi:hypothetical protein